MSEFSIEKMRDNVAAAESLLKSLGNANRLMVLCNLVDQERSVGELEQLVGLSQSSLSQHLAKLKQQNILASRKVGTTVYYSLTNREAIQVLALLYSMYCSE